MQEGCHFLYHNMIGFDIVDIVIELIYIVDVTHTRYPMVDLLFFGIIYTCQNVMNTKKRFLLGNRYSITILQL